jgi:hypothetical protein
MLNEEIRAKLVQRADDVAQHEEIENYTMQICAKFRTNVEFRTLH